jgi:hypothetical protein
MPEPAAASILQPAAVEHVMLEAMLVERWFGIGSVVLAFAATGAAASIALRPTHHHHHRGHHAAAALDLRPMRCKDTVAIRPPVPVAAPTAYTDLIGELDVHHCFEGAAIERVDMLISIARDGRVRSVSPRPERPSPVSRCIEQELQGWRFSGGPNDSAVSIRYAFTR